MYTQKGTLKVEYNNLNIYELMKLLEEKAKEKKEMYVQNFLLKR